MKVKDILANFFMECPDYFQYSLINSLKFDLLNKGTGYIILHRTYDKKHKKN